MRRTVSSRRLRLLATALLVALAFAAGSVVAALGDDALTYYACAGPSGSLGQIRVGTAPECGPNSTLVSWDSGSTPETVSWNDITAIPADVSNRVAADLVCTNAAGCVDGSDIVDGSVTSSDRRANAQMATVSGRTSVGVGTLWTLPVVLDQPGDGQAHLVELQTQAHVSCRGADCADGAVVDVELRADGVAVATVPLRLPAAATDSVPVTLSWVVTHASVSSVTPHTYEVTFKTPGTPIFLAVVFDPMIYAIDLGTVGP